MELYSIILTSLELIGTVAFSVSGAMVAVSRGLDLFGVLFLGCITAFGGGITRDLLLGNTPPSIFSKPLLLLLAVLAALAVFIVAYFNAKHFSALSHKVDRINLIFDSLGLAAFAVTGTEIACTAGYANNALLAITMGVLTCVGGGIFRDILADQTPYVLKKHVYAMASIAGAGLYYLLRTYTSLQNIGSIVSMLLVVTIRLLAAHYRWKLPKVPLE
jgi:uncharacterized membrane protein YeiH